RQPEGCPGSLAGHDRIPSGKHEVMPVEPSPELIAQHPRDRTILFCCAAGLCALFGYYLLYIAGVRVSHGHDGDFPTFYDAGRAVRHHTDPYTPEPGGMAYVYPPLFAVLCVPLT